MVATPEAGVPRAGVTMVQEVVRQTFPVPLPATKVTVDGSVVPVFKKNPVVGAAGSVIMYFVVTETGAWKPTALVGAVVEDPSTIAMEPFTPPPLPVLIEPGVIIFPLESIVAVVAAV